MSARGQLLVCFASGQGLLWFLADPGDRTPTNPKSEPGSSLGPLSVRFGTVHYTNCYCIKGLKWRPPLLLVIFLHSYGGWGY